MPQRTKQEKMRFLYKNKFNFFFARHSLRILKDDNVIFYFPFGFLFIRLCDRELIIRRGYDV